MRYSNTTEAQRWKILLMTRKAEMALGEKRGI